MISAQSMIDQFVFEKLGVSIDKIYRQTLTRRSICLKGFESSEVSSGQASVWPKKLGPRNKKVKRKRSD